MMKNSLVMLCWRAAQRRPGRSGAMATPPTAGGGAAARIAMPMMAGAAWTAWIRDAGTCLCLGRRGGGGDGVAARRTTAGAGAAPGTERQH